MRSVEEAHDQARALLALIDSASGVNQLGERHAHLIVAMAAVSRCRSLLLGILELDSSGRTDLVGVLLRALLEVWYFGVIALLGDRTDLDLFEADHRYWRNKLAENLGDIAAEAGTAKNFKVWDRAQRADELLVSIGEPEGVAREYYKQVFVGESLTSAHASFESLNPYVSEDPDGTVRIVHEPDPDERYRYGRLRVAAVLTALLAKWTWERIGLDGTTFDRLGYADPTPSD